MTRHSMKLLETLVTALAVSAVSGLEAPTSVSAVCAQASDYTAFVIASIQRLVTSTDTALIRVRNEQQWPLSRHPRSPRRPTTRYCAKAEAAYMPAVGRTPPTPFGTAYVYQIGTVYYVYDRGEAGGERVIVMTTDRKFNILAKGTM